MSWTKCYKLTDENHQTRNNTQWGENVENPDGVKDGVAGLCTPSWYHGYDNKFLAVILNPIHADIKKPLLWEAEWGGTKQDEGTKFGSTEFRTIKIIPTPHISLNKRVDFAIYCVKEVFYDPWWNKWADKWLSKKDNTYNAAAKAVDAAYAAAAANVAYATNAYAAADAAKAAAANVATADAYAAANVAYAVADAYASSITPHILIKALHLALIED